MSKCGKGCIPECEYFTTGGCTSPFNCAYKIEEHNQNTVFTNGDTNDLSGIEKFYINTVKSGVLPQEPMNYDGAAMKAYISYLESENAELRERLEKSVEFPRTEISPYNSNDTLLYYIAAGHIQQECFNNKFPEQLQARLAELKGGKE